MCFYFKCTQTKYGTSLKQNSWSEFVKNLNWNKAVSQRNSEYVLHVTTKNKHFHLLSAYLLQQL